MPIDIVVPEMGESVKTGLLSSWVAKDGEMVRRDQVVAEIETDKITLELRSPVGGKLGVRVPAGTEVAVGGVVAQVDEAHAGVGPSVGTGEPVEPVIAGAPIAVVPDGGRKNGTNKPAPDDHPPREEAHAVRATPLAKKVAHEHGVDISAIPGTGAGGRVREADVLTAVKSPKPAPAPQSLSPQAPAASPAAPAAASAPGDRAVRRERMSPLRQRVAARLVQAQHTAAMLTTFNEVDMSAVMALRASHKEEFEKKQGVGLGFMSFFVRACAAALARFPQVNASIAADASGQPEIEYHDYCDIAVAVGTPKGLVVPVLRDAHRLSFADIERGIKDLATRAKDGKLALADLQGGTFTITNGGVYGSLMSTPILNPPQTGILGMHAIKPRAVEWPLGSGQVAIRPMMYLALSYDHRLIDGADAVQFLVSVKQSIEQPERLLLGM